MTFFQQQAAAKQRTRTLLVLFGVTVVCIVASIHIVLVLLFAGQSSSVSKSAPEISDLLFDPTIFGITSSVTLFIIIFGTLVKVFQLRGGGAQVATSLGGSLIPADTQEYQLRTLLNVVEEMAIASGTPVPPVYLIPEPP